MKKLSYWDELKYSQDWKSIITGTSMFFLIVLFFVFILNRSYLEMKLAGNNKSGITTGFIVNRVEHTDFRQTVANGNQFYVNKIYFYYTCIVNGKTYYGNEPLSFSIAIAQEINRARKEALPYPVTVRYDKHNPQQSIIWFK